MEIWLHPIRKTTLTLWHYINMDQFTEKLDCQIKVVRKYESWCWWNPPQITCLLLQWYCLCKFSRFLLQFLVNFNFVYRNVYLVTILDRRWSDGRIRGVLPHGSYEDRRRCNSTPSHRHHWCWLFTISYRLPRLVCCLHQECLPVKNGNVSFDRSLILFSLQPLLAFSY